MDQEINAYPYADTNTLSKYATIDIIEMRKTDPVVLRATLF